MAKAEKFKRTTCGRANARRADSAPGTAIQPELATLESSTARRMYRYAFLRTRTALCYADSAMASLAHAIGSQVELLTLTRRSPTWEDGMVIRFLADESPAELATKWRETLSNFDAWAIHDAHGLSSETIVRGPIASAFKSAHAQGTLGMTQLYFAFRRKDSNRSQTGERLRQALQVTSVPVFHFRDGRILLLDTHEPATTTQRRLEGKRLALYWYAICDAGHNALVLTANPGRCWTVVSLDELVTTDAGAPEIRHVSVDHWHRSTARRRVR